ncbi:FAD-dependent oxidoreductase [Amycolatopsis mongoliensis]|uniref:FAD-dependent oxidoreductase n=1 Tax=Amycolatopsis mongoliensis TaxID=715475 RepID=A0A9Y2NDU3_9PSEU|nr:FAD-dependent oxidoreductase [Amycolatopsis sp. 4-36]WIY01082.1 FAD-dependent oxidoreductase [Amycolatopsis sp. 4-36]
MTPDAGREPARVVVVGASAAGLAVVEAARSQGYRGELTLIGDEPHLPYDRPPLSKQLLTGDWPPERLLLREQAHLDGLAVTMKLGQPASTVDADAREVVLADGDRVPYDALVVTTGVRARCLPGSDGISGVHVLRTLQDALALRAELVPGRRLVVLGAGVLGAEAAAVARGLGAEVTVLDPLAWPLARIVNREIGGWLAEVHREHGVDLRCSCAPVTGLHAAEGHVAAVELADGTVLPADTVLVAIGATPAVEWLAGSPVTIGGPEPASGSGGVLCDPRGQAAPGIYAAGDVAAWQDPATGEYRRYEHRLNATEQGRAVARALLDPGFTPPPSVPYFWSDQYDLKLQTFGTLDADDEFIVVDGSLGARRFIGVSHRDGLVRGALGVGMPRQLRAWRTAVAEHAPWKETTPA